LSLEITSFLLGQDGGGWLVGIKKTNEPGLISFYVYAIQVF